ncbi:HAMP domain-containing protein [Agrobacterium vitis]|uniref:Methyl-accepting chemotaxis protein n=2 Tax=Rhizobium/Agrobacterium group TaxID=227290 RepID=B9JS54_ALLAM|nr:MULTISPECIES: HAMP domain-containing methyl-accepting chemotaxis protein [Rhizobium/Agrobacterium group]ACM37682.1 methyl-accepting chemotaxis protein [Allorhizobium ampelinum S4]MCF1433849.1 methyl-accepting chemotaxis protein [Allorhizobium ampelinum]MCF1447588.1 methyl-accepting chemotaxis protein [Allorhizobium ampelinum]MCF1493095.1 methyl-accepting chemotaxis protein [Allorhizobium ampelinum]MUO29148.1 HAMP domain-containing protein [Agrobacterium vitis]
MSFLDNLKIKTKILSVVVSICALGIGASVMLSQGLNAVDKEYSAFIDQDAGSLMMVARSSQRLMALGYDAYQILVYDDSSPEIVRAKKDYDESVKRIIAMIDEAIALDPAKADRLAAIRTRYEAIITITSKVIDLDAKKQDTEARDELRQADKLIAETADETRRWVVDGAKELSDKSTLISNETRNTIIATLGGLFVAFILAIFAALWIISHGITRPIERLRLRMIALAKGETRAEIDGAGRGDELGQMAAAVAVFRDNALDRERLEAEAEASRGLSEKERAERDAQRAKDAADTKFAVDALAEGLTRLADGDVSYRIAVPFVAGLDGLRSNFNSSVQKLQQALVTVRQNARGIDAGANEIRSAADDLSHRTEQQAASVEETAAALEQITTTVKDSTRRAEEAGILVSKTRDGAERSGDVVRKAVAAMQEIERSSGEISNIIGVIDEIAFQTNLLALNAGVEAARAGEAGKGFAVVAQEVRELAQRSANAAKDIKGLIVSSGQQVQAGVQLVAETGSSLETIVGEVQEINRHVTAIVEAAREQSVGLQEINTAVNTMDQGTQQNAAMVEQTTAASHSLAKEAATLSDLLSRFKLEDHGKVVAFEQTNDVSASRPAPSPARKLTEKLRGAFHGSAAVKEKDWQDF